ncbi:hypothetical protein TNCT_111891 [Trichonephila clavata]|uniref:Uncharacterized protein n=1 Tax=Trichonephila clavata TaxID=2740835 RepID=A0A8X6HGW2_TRICU|nr:hypothetical protein TNCT_111891 [Trichonephila clavata]
MGSVLLRSHEDPTDLGGKKQSVTETRARNFLDTMSPIEALIFGKEKLTEGRQNASRVTSLLTAGGSTLSSVTRYMRIKTTSSDRMFFVVSERYFFPSTRSL